MSDLLKKSTADFINPSDRAVSSAFRAGLTKMSMGGGSVASGCGASGTAGRMHSLLVKLSVMASLCSLAMVLKAFSTSSLDALPSNPVNKGLLPEFRLIVVVVVDVVVVVVVVAVA